MIKTLKVFDFLHGSSNYWSQHGFKLVSTLKDADILCLNGGGDIGTEIYNEEPVHNYYSSFRYKSHRDKQEIDQYEEAKHLGKFIFGICRGAQLATCLEGGSLWQHVTGHMGDHPMRDLYTGKMYNTTSIHHQMMRPPKSVEHQVIAVANKSTYKVSQQDEWRLPETGEYKDDPEVVWYPHARALCVQGHPEYATKSKFADYCTELTNHLFENQEWPAKGAEKYG